MSNGDFEVMPRGTIEEVSELRRLTKELIALDSSHRDSMPFAISAKIGEISRFYKYHSEKYPVTV